MGSLLIAGAALLALGASAAALPRGPALGVWIQAVGAAAIGIAGSIGFLSGDSVGAAFASELEPRLGVDPLSGFFLAMLGLVATPALVYATAYLRDDARGRATAVLCAPFVLSLTLVITARDPLTFLTGWELMTLVPAAVILVTHADAAARRAVFVYVAVTHLGGAGVWVALLLLASHDAIGGEGLTSDSGLYVAVTLAAIVGFGTKAGVLPLHAWLPRAHPLAPAPVSALMSGVMVKVAVYGLVRVLVEWTGPAPIWVGALVLALGALSAVGGILYALFQRDLKKLLAFSTIDNVGITFLGLGACLLFRAHGEDAWAALALGAALLHALNHAAFKGLLFLGAGSLERAAGTVDLDRLGGMLRQAPWTGSAILVGCAAIAGVPPLNGFASEWLTAQALLRLPAVGDVPDGALGALSLAALATAAALAVYCFVKVVGQALLGPPNEHTAGACEVPTAMRAATLALAVACVALGLAPGAIYGRLAALAPGADAIETTAGLDVPGSGGLPTPALALVLIVFFGALVLARRTSAAPAAPTWACGQEAVPALGWTGAGFTKSLRLVLEALLRPEREITVETRGGVVRSVTYTGRVPHLVDEYVYRPVTVAALRLAAASRRVQSGRLGTYVAYLGALVVALLLAVKLGALG